MFDEISCPRRLKRKVGEVVGVLHAGRVYNEAVRLDTSMYATLYLIQLVPLLAAVAPVRGGSATLNRHPWCRQRVVKARWRRGEWRYLWMMRAFVNAQASSHGWLRATVDGNGRAWGCACGASES